jgi:hypothetical protein
MARVVFRCYSSSYGQNQTTCPYFRGSGQEPGPTLPGPKVASVIGRAFVEALRFPSGTVGLPVRPLRPETNSLHRYAAALGA